jgi:adenylate cyclase
MTSKHHLAAIMFSDIVGYSATSHRDGEMAAKQIARHRAVLEKTVLSHDGEILNYYGDGSLCIFQSAVDAVHCALQIQKQQRGIDGIPLRIGIHLGEVYFESEQYIGDGINIAARIQAEASSGNVLVSEAVYALVHNRSDLELRYIGEKSLKNISTPIKLYDVAEETHDQPRHVQTPQSRFVSGFKRRSLITGLLAIGILVVLAVLVLNGFLKPAMTKTSIAIIPFTSLSDIEEDRYFSEGIADDIRSRLAAISAIDVRSRSSSAFVREHKMSAREIGKALDIRYILEGSVQRIGEGLQLNLALIDAHSDQLIQPIRYQMERPEDLFTMQSSITERVLDLVQVRLLPEERGEVLSVETTNFDAHRYYLLGQAYLLKSGSVKDLETSENYFQQAIDEDPKYARAWAGFAEVRIFRAAWGYGRVSEALPAAREAASTAFKLNPNMAEAQQTMGTIYEFDKQFDLAEKAFRRAIELDPSYMLSYLRMARIKDARYAHDEAIRYAERAAKLDPLSPVAVSIVPTMLLRANKIDEATNRCLSYLETFPDDPGLLWNLGEVYAVAGKYDEAIQALRSRDIPTPDYNFVLGYCYARRGDISEARHILDYLLEKNKKAYVPPAMIASIYHGLGDRQKALEWLSKEENYFLVLLPILKSLQDDPAFQAIYAFRKT